MAAGWYVLQVYSGWENKVEKIFNIMLKSGELDKNVVRSVKIPTKTVTEEHIRLDKTGKEHRSQRKYEGKYFPGYLFLELDLPDQPDISFDESGNKVPGWKATCSAIKKVQGVMSFVGVPGDRKPLPLNVDEAKSILQLAGDLKGDKSVGRVRQNFDKGEAVKIIDGPFESFTGSIDEVNFEKSKLTVLVGIFGRNTPVEVDFTQVEKV